MDLVGNPLGPVVGLVAFLASLAAQAAAERHVRPLPALLAGGIAAAAFPLAHRALWSRRALWLITVGGRRPRWVGYAPSPGRRAAAARGRRERPTGSPPALRELVRVVPVGQTQRAAAATLTLLSIEVFADGFLVHGRLLWDDEAAAVGGTAPTGPSWHAEAVDLRANDDCGGRYDAWPRGGGGGGAEWRFQVAFAPAPDPLARELRLTVPALVWHRFSPFPGGPPAEERVEEGPWVFAVPLADPGPPSAAPVAP